MEMQREENPKLFIAGVAAYLDVDIAEAVQYITDGGNDGRV